MSHLTTSSRQSTTAINTCPPRAFDSNADRPAAVSPRLDAVEHERRDKLATPAKPLGECHTSPAMASERTAMLPRQV